MKLTDDQKAFLLDTISYYGEDVSRRATRNGYCGYRLDGKKCAIGRHIPDEKYYPGLEEEGTIYSNSVQEVLPLEVLNLGIDFLGSLQVLHDVQYLWNKDSGLSERGKEYIKNAFGLIVE